MQTSGKRSFSTRIKAVLVVVIVVVVALGAYYFVAPQLAPQRTLRVMTWGGDLLEAAKFAGNEFTKQTGVQVTYILHSGGSAAALAKFQAEAPNYEADVYFAAPAPEIVAAQNGWLVPLTASDIPNLNSIPDIFKQSRGGTVYSVLATVTVTTWGYRTDHIQGPITSMSQLINPAYKGKLAVPPPTFAPGRALILMSLWKGGDQYNIEPGFQAANQLASDGYIGSVFSSDADMSSLLTTGRAWAVLGPAGNVYAAAKQGAPVAIARTLSDAKLPTDAIVIGALNTPQQDLAKKFINVLLSPGIISQYCNTIGDSPTNPNAQVNATIAPWVVSPSDLSKFAYTVNDTWVGSQITKWENRWETEILPLIHVSSLAPILPTFAVDYAVLALVILTIGPAVCLSRRRSYRLSIAAVT